MLPQLLYEKYRAKTIEEFIFQDPKVEANVLKWIEEKAFPNMLLVGTPGTGKSTLADIIIKSIGFDPSDVKRVNASLTNGISFIRDELEPWMRKASFGGFKVVLLEEADQITRAGQLSLRDLIESSSDHVRFIFTANYGGQIVDALHSRFTSVITMGNALDENALINRVCDIVEGENLEVKSDDDLLSHIDAYAPDLRKIINSIQNSIVDGVLTRATVASGVADFGKWVDYWNGSDISLEGALSLTEGVDKNNYDGFYETLYESNVWGDKTGECVVIISEYVDRAQRCANQRLHLDACIYRLFMAVAGDE